ncbi:MAG: flagellar hook-length control protein FliK, partial [Caldimicrobium sp.]
DISASVWNAFLLFLRAVIVSSMDIQNAKVANQNSKVDTEPNSQGTSSTINGNFFQNLAYIQFFPEGSLSTERFLATQSLQETTLAVGKITTLLRESLDSYANSRNASQEEKNLLAHLSQKLEERLQTFNMVNEEGTSFLNAARDSFLKFLEEKVFEVPERNPKNSLIKEEPLAKEAFSLKSLGEKFNHLQDETKIDIANKIASLNKEFPLDEVLKKDFSQKYEKEPIHSKTNLSNHFEWAINFVSPTEKSIFKNSQAFSQNKELVKIENLTQFIKNFTIELKPSGERSALLELEPPELGKMEVTVKLKESEVEIVAKVEKAETLAHLKQEFLQIKTELENLGLKLKDFQLSLGLSGDERSFGERNGERREERKEKVNRAATEGLGETPTLLYRGRLYKIV